MSRSSEIINNVILRNKIIDLMHKANNAIIKIYKNPNNKIEYKNDNSPLTEADLAANTILSKNLKDIFPDIPIVSEEDTESLLIPKEHNIYPHMFLFSYTTLPQLSSNFITFLMSALTFH